MARVRTIVRVAGWNLLGSAFVCLLIGTAFEAWFRLIGPFWTPLVDLGQQPGYWRFVPGVGLLRPPHRELHYSDGRDYWTVQRANRWGFLDREPIDPDRAAESCHIAVIGDSFVEAKEVPISDKLQVVLEEMAAREAPHLDVTTSAFGISGTAQMSQLAFYDRYARRLKPDLVILVLILNDFDGNDPRRRPPRVSSRLRRGFAIRGENGGFIWLPPALDFPAAAFPLASERLDTWRTRALYRAARASRFVRWLGARTLWLYRGVPGFAAAGGAREGGAHVSELPETRTVRDWFSSSDDFSDDDPIMRYLRRGDLLFRTAAFDESRGLNAVSLQQFKRRTDHDGAALVALDGWYSDHWTVHALGEAAESLGIPVVSLREYVTRRGGRIEDLRWSRDNHWTPTGHRRAAEAIWEHIETEWGGECPSAAPRPDVEVDWVAVEEAPMRSNAGRPVPFRDPVRLRKRFLTPEGETWLEVFPAFDSAGYRSVYESVSSGAPAARSTWDVHLYGGGVTWLKEPCAAEDTDAAFFLHVFAADASDLPADSRPRGFERFEFRFRRHGAGHDGTCMVSADLPEYDVAGIRTGQAVDGAEAWSARVQFGRADP